MRYMFKILTLGDSKLSLQMIKNGKLIQQFQDHEISRWTKTINVATDQAVIEIDAVLTSTVDFDNIIPTSDGILYFLDPNNFQQFELFEMIIQIIHKMGRTIPIVVVFFCNTGVIRTPSNYLMEYIWDNYLMEAFVFDMYSKNTFYEVLECLCEAIITGTIPINVETTWMRIPFFMQKINRLMEDERYEDAGNLAEILTNMKKKFAKQDYFMTAEQAAWLYYKAGEYYKASVALQVTEPSHLIKKFVRIFVENLIHQGSRLYNMKRFHTAAELFEKAYLYASIELNDDALAENALKLAITTWIIATEFQNAFRLLEKLDLNHQFEQMKQLTPQIAEAVDHLIEAKRYDIVKGLLYFIIDNFQRNGLFEEIKILGNKIVIVLKILIDQYINENDPDSANLTLNELFNIWDTFHIDREDVDVKIRAIAILFLNKNQFSMVDKLITYVQLYTIQHELTELRQQGEEEYRKKLKDTAYTQFANAVSVLKSYVEKEIGIFNQSNNEFLKHIEQLKKDQKILEATSEIKKRADWYKNVGHVEISIGLLIRLLDLYLDFDMFLPFLQEMVNLRTEERENYLKRNIGRIQNKIEILIDSDVSLEKIDEILDRFAKLYRNHLLYDETKDIERLHVKFKISRAKKLLSTSSGVNEIPNALDLLKQADMIYQRLSEKEELNYDSILEEITSRYITQIEEKLKEKHLVKEQGGERKLEETLLKEIERTLNETNKLNERIKNSKIQSKFHKRIVDIENEIAKDREAEKIEAKKITIMVEKLTRLRTMANDELIKQQDTLFTREGYKRIHYQDLLLSLENQEYVKALDGYERVAQSLFSQRKMDLADIDLAVITILLFKLNQKGNLQSIRKKFSKSSGFVSEVIDFIITLINYPDQSIHLLAIKLFENLALFREEKAVLHQLIKPTSVTYEPIEQVTTSDRTPARGVTEDLLKMYIDKMKIKPSQFSKRKSLELKYWKQALDAIETQNYSEAAKEYFEKIDLLVKNGHEEFFPTSFVIGIVCYLKAGKSQEAKRRVEKAVMEISLPQDVIQNQPEFKLTEYLVLLYQQNDEEKTDLIYESFYDYLPLFPQEKSILFSLISPIKRTKIQLDKSRGDRVSSESSVIQAQQLSNLNKREPEERERLEEVHRRRNAMKRLVYRKVLELMLNKEYKPASEEYFDLAVKQTTKRDYDAASVLIVLGCLCLLRIESELSVVQSYLDKFLNKIGYTEKIISETFTVKLIRLILDAKSIKNTAIIDEAWQLFNIIPVFEEENVLFEK